MIEVKNLTKIYQIPKSNYTKNLWTFLWPPKEDKIGVSQISFKIEPGEIVGFVGPNGAGKTTTIKMLSGILTPSNGSINVFGYTPSKDRSLYTKEIGVLMGQRSILFYDIPVIDSFYFYKDVYSLEKEQFVTRLNLLVEKLGLKDLLNIPVRKLSLGQRMRCEIVASILHNPKILFLDEPTLGLDVVGKQSIIEFLSYLNTTFNTTIFLTTHDLNDIDRLCERIIIMDKGKIHYDGSIKNLHSRDEYKIIEIYHKATFDHHCLGNKGERVLSNSQKTRLKLHKEDVPQIVEKLNYNSDVVDFNINLISLEEIITEIYNIEKDEKSYA